MNDQTFIDSLAAEQARVFAAHPELLDHRKKHPWLRGSLGDPFAPVWFIAENPSLNMVRKMTGLSENDQWAASRGDQIFRDCLHRYGFKTGEPLSAGGWRCYITNVIKSADVVKHWRALRREEQDEMADWWAPVLKYELTHGRPQLVVALGTKAHEHLQRLERQRLIPKLPPLERIHHYSYIGQRPDNRGRGPGDPARIEEWAANFKRFAERSPLLTVPAGRRHLTGGNRSSASLVPLLSARQHSSLQWRTRIGSRAWQRRL